MGFFSPESGGHEINLGGSRSRDLAVFGVAVHYPGGHVVPMHQHPYGHLIYADSGLLRVESDSGQWIVPPTAAVWLRPNVQHRLVVPVALQAHGLFVHEDMCASLPNADCVVHVSSLMRELIISLSQANDEKASINRNRLVGELLIEEINTQQVLPFNLPWPSESLDVIISKVCRILIENPSDKSTSSEWASRLALTEKTFYRRFLRATGMTFSRWRHQLRLMSSITLLMQGKSITQVALASGYDSHSAYTTAFSKQFGMPPSVFR